ncbi:MAG TPA: right-handed parallel beta-helix repeat-containing protein, partial [Ardenticatenaceae bacterium]
IEGAIAQDGIQLLGWPSGDAVCEHNIIEGNTISATIGSNTAMGIRISGGGGVPSRYNVIANNVIHHVALEALPVDSAEFNTWTGNTVVGCGYGMSIASSISGTVVGNVFKDCSAAGILIEPYSAEHSVMNNVFDSNIIVNCGTNSTTQDAVRVLVGVGTAVQHNRFVNNYIEGGNRYGIVVTAPWTSMVGNTIKSSGYTGIQIAADNTQVQDNTIIDPIGDGIYGAGNSRATIVGNRISGTNRSGLSGIFLNGSTLCVVSSNNVTGFTVGGGKNIKVPTLNGNNVVANNVCELSSITVASGNIAGQNFG